MKTTMSQGEKSIDARLYCGSTFGDEAEATIEIKAKGIHHTDLAPLISSAPDLLEACKVALSSLHHYTDGMESCDMPVKDEMAIAALESAIDRATTEKEGAK